MEYSGVTINTTTRVLSFMLFCVARRQIAVLDALMYDDDVASSFLA